MSACENMEELQVVPVGPELGIDIFDSVDSLSLYGDISISDPADQIVELQEMLAEDADETNNSLGLSIAEEISQPLSLLMSVPHSHSRLIVAVTIWSPQNRTDSVGYEGEGWDQMVPDFGLDSIESNGSVIQASNF